MYVCKAKIYIVLKILRGRLYYIILSGTVLPINYGDSCYRVGHHNSAVFTSQQQIECFHRFKFIIIENLYIGTLSLEPTGYQELQRTVVGAIVEDFCEGEEGERKLHVQ